MTDDLQNHRSDIMQRMHYERRMRDEMPWFKKEEKNRILKERLSVKNGILLKATFLGGLGLSSQKT